MARLRRKSKTPSDRGAFTLVELLIVIVILGLLMALLVPSLRGVWQRYNMTRCQTNLAHIYQAFRLRAADEAMGEARAYLVAGWTGALMPYLENDFSQFFCTETSEGAGASGKFINELVEFKTHPRDLAPDFFTQLVEGPFMLKLSDTQYRAIRAENDTYLKGAGKLRDEVDCNFQPDGNPDVAWYCLEDHPFGIFDSCDYNFSDVLAKVTYKGDGTITVEMTCLIRRGFSDYLMDKNTGEQLAVIPDSGHGGTTPTIVTLESGEFGAEPTSYGMNEYAIDKVTDDGELIRGVGGAGGKILVLDYSRPVASPDKDDWMTDEVFNPDQSGVPRFARHFGMANILFSDGSVQPMRPADIDPFEPTAEMKWWMP
jgi:prepilin-type N-terminal cleavage/methylation domain-containing protein/prepilin-type processing-associated H-X9-DG protein